MKRWDFDPECLSCMEHRPRYPPVLLPILKVEHLTKIASITKSSPNPLKTLQNRDKDIIRVNELGSSQMSAMYLR